MYGSLVPDTTATPQSPGTTMPGSIGLLKSTRTCILQKKKAKVCQDATKFTASYHSCISQKTKKHAQHLKADFSHYDAQRIKNELHPTITVQFEPI